MDNGILHEKKAMSSRGEFSVTWNFSIYSFELKIVPPLQLCKAPIEETLHRSPD